MGTSKAMKTWETDRRKIFRLCRCSAFPIYAPILTMFDDVLHLLVWSADVSLKWDFFPLAFPLNCARRYFATPTNLNCLLLTFRCFISSLACNHQSIRSCSKESRHAATRYADTGLNDMWKSFHYIYDRTGNYIVGWKGRITKVFQNSLPALKNYTERKIF